MVARSKECYSAYGKGVGGAVAPYIGQPDYGQRAVVFSISTKMKTFLGCLDGGIFCIGVPALLIALFPALGVWLKKKCKCKCKCEHETVDISLKSDCNSKK